MNYVLSVSIFIFFIFLELVSGEVWYEAQFTDSILSCDDFDNDVVNADGIKLGLTDGSDDEDPGFGLNGNLVINSPIDDSLDVSMDIYKDTEIGKEYMMKARVNLCKSLDDPDTPWWPIFQMMNISCCPIDKGEYFMNNLVLSIDAFDEVLSRDFCGDYSVELSMVKDVDTKLSCHNVQVAIVEHEKDD